MEDKYIIQDFSIVSSECDYQLFFCSDYQRVVTESINKLLADYESKNPGFNYEERESKLRLSCHEGFIVISDKRENPTIYLLGILESYNGTIDKDKFVFGVM